METVELVVVGACERCENFVFENDFIFSINLPLGGIRPVRLCGDCAARFGARMARIHNEFFKTWLRLRDAEETCEIEQHPSSVSGLDTERRSTVDTGE